MSEWKPIETAPRDGSAFLGYGIHDTDHITNTNTHWRKGDHWWGIILWDKWRSGEWSRGDRWVFSKDGMLTWAMPTHWMPLPEPPGGFNASAGKTP